MARAHVPGLVLALATKVALGVLVCPKEEAANSSTTPSREPAARDRFDHLRKFYGKLYFWHRAYYVGSVGGVSFDTMKRYVEAQGTKGRHPLSPWLSSKKGKARVVCSNRLACVEASSPALPLSPFFCIYPLGIPIAVK